VRASTGAISQQRVGGRPRDDEYGKKKDWGKNRREEGIGKKLIEHNVD